MDEKRKSSPTPNTDTGLKNPALPCSTNNPIITESTANDAISDRLATPTSETITIDGADAMDVQSDEAMIKLLSDVPIRPKPSEQRVHRTRVISNTSDRRRSPTSLIAAPYPKRAPARKRRRIVVKPQGYVEIHFDGVTVKTRSAITITYMDL